MNCGCDLSSGYWVAGPVTVNDLITSGNAAIEWHHNQPARLEQVTTDDWTRQVRRRDLRFGDLLPDVDATVHDIAISRNHTHQRQLLETLSKLEKRLDEFGRESRDEALIRYVSTNTGQSRQRTTRLLQTEDDPILAVRLQLRAYCADHARTFHGGYSSVTCCHGQRRA